MAISIPLKQLACERLFDFLPPFSNPSRTEKRATISSLLSPIEDLENLNLIR